MIRHSQNLCIAVAAATCLGLFSSQAIAAEAGKPPRWQESGVGLEDYELVEGTDQWALIPGGASSDDRQWKFEAACLEDEDIAIDCLPLAPECDAGEEGRPVQWLWRSESLGIDNWTPYDEFGCVYSSNPNDVLEEIADRILSEFRNLPIRAGSISTEPSPHTLIGANTNVYASVDSQTLETGLLGQKIRIEATPIEYRWDYGDGSSPVSIGVPGGPLPRERWGEATPTSHVYESTGDYSVSLTTTFRGTYSVNGGPAIPIPGTGTFTATPVTISVWRSVVNNYADNCLENPDGAGC